ncbi:MAG: protease family protein [Frankiaceae bacterium]|jgi:membrane protease YdiL (CAAX protease family)|nr:protease family protein [Frankiaceae bacterium]
MHLMPSLWRESSPDVLARLGGVAVIAFVLWSTWRSYKRTPPLLRGIREGRVPRVVGYRRFFRNQAVRCAAVGLAIILIRPSAAAVGFGNATSSKSLTTTAHALLNGLVAVELCIAVVVQGMLVHRGRLRRLLRPVAPLIPSNAHERAYWLGLSLGAGISEEFLYRGVLPVALTAVVPGIGPGSSLILASLLFGVAHLYQGWIGVIGTTVAGFLFGLVVVAAGNLWLAVLIHAAFDARICLFPASAAAPSSTTDRPLPEPGTP